VFVCALVLARSEEALFFILHLFYDAIFFVLSFGRTIDLLLSKTFFPFHLERSCTTPTSSFFFLAINFFNDSFPRNLPPSVVILYLLDM